MPEERWAAARLGNQEAACKARVSRAAIAQQLEEQRRCDNVGIFWIVGKMNERSIGFYSFASIGGFSKQGCVRAQQQLVHEPRIENASGVNEAPIFELVSNAKLVIRHGARNSPKGSAVSTACCPGPDQ